MAPGKSQLLPTSDSDPAHTTKDLIRGQPSFQKKAQLLLKNNYVVVHARKRHPPDKHRSKRKGTRDPHEELQIMTRDMELNLEDKADLKRTGLLGP
ncbi:hypothetical protein B296_00017249 [Ensete ventricosum]|uniref:Uncharacterized protein n=1 Tax=Ensete ventricosum TaxID=4639 RepID=A0A426Z2Z9_ENSVE|nr:hypothetical protein B296_00017249 [Ensete ventricosum]